MTVSLATWNVNSLKVRLNHLLDWLGAHRADIVCLQETKLIDEQFPVAALREAGYAAAFAGQKTYNGVALLARADTMPAPVDVVATLPDPFEDTQKRLIAATVGPLRVVCAYFPNGQSVDSDKYVYKLRWIAALAAWLRGEMERHPLLALAGDYNIAPEDRDVHDPKAWAGQVLFSEPERQAFRDLLALGMVDCFRLFDQPDRSYTWWDYRMLAFRRKMGLRIDHILLSPRLAPSCTACSIDIEPRRREQPSDHAPVIASLSL
ncbi:MAG TPA: exodeoxyribonuclease III [Burkholderiaceae bacterium]|nr:exodeoxyribonuclease III [Burkholderiaceae bacterium]